MAGYIDAWGRGTLKILTECQLNKLPEPIFKFEFSGFTVEFNWSKTTQKILDTIDNNPCASLDEIAMLIRNISRDGVKYQINKPKRANIIRQIGPDKGGYWEIIKQ